MEPFAGIVDSVRRAVPRVLFNFNAVGPFKRKRRVNDLVVAGDVTQQVRRAAEMLGWWKELEDIMQENDKVQNAVTR